MIRHTIHTVNVRDAPQMHSQLEEMLVILYCFPVCVAMTFKYKIFVLQNNNKNSVICNSSQFFKTLWAKLSMVRPITSSVPPPDLNDFSNTYIYINSVIITIVTLYLDLPYDNLLLIFMGPVPVNSDGNDLTDNSGI